MRDLRFRAWNTRRKEMEMIDDLYWFEENHCMINGDNDYVIQQHTGLKDKNGVEIYEGDYLWSTGSHRGIVVFEEGRFFVSVWNIKKDIHESDEVVGNIFEGVDK